MGVADLVKVALAVGAAAAISYCLVVIRHPPEGTIVSLSSMPYSSVY